MPKPSDPTLDLATAAISQDAILKARVQSLVITAIDRLERTLVTGAPAEVTQALRAFIPAMARALTTEVTDDNLANLKNEMQEMWAEMLEPYGMQEAQEQMEVGEDSPDGVVTIKAPITEAAS